ncbi:MAG TPA: hypothetical protein VEK10_11990 [Steroidobacteraceae bacterium]|nr:hypothetical protein [Steroidobacteraceae bacterium]
MNDQHLHDPQSPQGPQGPLRPRRAQDPRQGDSRRAALLGLLVALLLVMIGLIVVRVLGNAARIQDCAMSGRSNCAPLDPAQQPP